MIYHHPDQSRSVRLSSHQRKILEMKKILISILCLLGTSAFAEYTPNDIRAITDHIYTSNKGRIAYGEIQQIVRHSFSEAEVHKISPFVPLGMVYAESNFRRLATSSVGAKGVMQVWPKWHKKAIAGRDIRNIGVNIEVGTAYLVDCLKRKGNLDSAFRCYSGGAGAHYGLRIYRAGKEYRHVAIMNRFSNELPINGVIASTRLVNVSARPSDLAAGRGDILEVVKFTAPKVAVKPRIPQPVVRSNTSMQEELLRAFRNNNHKAIQAIVNHL